MDSTTQNLQVKYFKSTNNIDKLEYEMNEWLNKNAGKITVFDIKYAPFSCTCTEFYSAMIIYSKL